VRICEAQIREGREAPRPLLLQAEPFCLIETAERPARFRRAPILAGDIRGF